MFSSENFAHCPMHFIQQALQSANEDKLFELAQHATPIAIAATAQLKAQGAKEVKPEWFNPYQRAIDKMQVRKMLRKEAAETFNELNQAGRLAPWLFHHRHVYEQIKLITEG